MNTRNKYTAIQQQQGGFTLVELLIAIAMFSFVLLFVSVTFIQINRSYSAGLTTKRVHEEGRTAMSALVQDFRTASTPAQVALDCDGDCSDVHTPTQVLCFDDKAYIFIGAEGDPDDPFEAASGRFVLAEGEDMSCDDAVADPQWAADNYGTEQFSGLVQPQFFKVTPIISNQTYKIELVITSVETDDLLTELSSGDDPRDIACEPGAPGSQFCRALYLESTVNLRSG